MARPTKYDPDYHPKKAYELCAEFGSSDKQLAKIFEVTETTINNWKKVYPEEFFERLRAGKDEYDSLKMEKALRKRGVGYRYTETTKEACATTVINEDGFEIPGPMEMRTTKTVSKHMAGDVHAQKFWLTKRSSERWPEDRQKIDLIGNLGINVNEMTEEHKAELKEIALLRAELALRERREGDNGKIPK